MCMGKVVFVAMQDPRGHGNSEAGGNHVALKIGAALRDDAREAGNDAEGETEGFVHDARQIGQAFQNGKFHLGVWIWKFAGVFADSAGVDIGFGDEDLLFGLL